MQHNGKCVAVAAAIVAATACGSAAGRAVGGTQGVSEQDRAWLTLAHQANLAEVTAGEMAEKKGGSPQIRAVGKMLVTDHTAFDKQVVRVAGQLNVKLPTTPTAEDAAAASRLGKESGGTFDHDFSATMITGHQKVIAGTQTEVNKGSAKEVISLARQALPTLNKHLTELRKAAPTG